MEYIFMAIGGLALFLFGMKSLSEGLRRAAGERLKRILKLLVKTPILGVLLGAAITAIIQSSSGTTVMTVGLVNAGLMALRQAISVVMGANIGTTVTAWIVAAVAFWEKFKIINYALPVFAIGFLMNIAGRSKGAKCWGQTLLGFGLLFLGLSFMKEAADPLEASEGVRKFLGIFSQQPILGVIAGALITMIFQSSSATVAMVILLASKGVIDFTGAIALVLGDNIGTTITAHIAAVGTSLAARRTARAHALFNVLGVCYMLPLVYLNLYARAIEAIIPGVYSAARAPLYVAASHTVFNVFNTFFVFLPLIRFLEKISIKLTPTRAEEVEIAPKYLEEHLLITPTVALEQAKREIVRMIGIARDAVSDGMEGFFKGNPRLLSRVTEKEEAVDNLQSEITQYLINISQRNLSSEEAQQLPVLLHSVNDVERVGDHAVNLVELAERKIAERLSFSDHAINELREMHREVNDMVDDVVKAFEANDLNSARRALKKEEKLNRLQIDLRSSHIERLNKGICQPLPGIVFLDLVDNLEKMGDHLTNIAQGVLGGLRWELAPLSSSYKE